MKDELEARTVQSLDDVRKNPWNHVVEQADQSSVFHRYEWLRAIEEGTQNQPRHIIVSKKGNPVGLLPNFIIDIDKTPFQRLASIDPGSGGPLILVNKHECINLFEKKLNEICTGNIISHLIRPVDSGYIRYQSELESRGYQTTISNCRFVLPLNRDWEKIYDNMTSSRRRAIRKGNSYDPEFLDEEITIANLAEFYNRYKSVMKRNETEALSRSFFQELLWIKDRIKIFSAKIDGETVGQLFYLLDEERSSLHYYFSGVTEDAFEYNTSELIHEHAIKWAIDNNYNTYDFGATTPDYNSGLFSFKESFGGKVIPTIAWEKGYSLLRWTLFRTARYGYKRYQARTR